MKQRLLTWLNELANAIYTKKYKIKSGYKANFFARMHKDNEEIAAFYQREVYRAAAALVKKGKRKRVVDVGCGYGVKLAEFIEPVAKEIVGIDVEHAIEYCKDKYGFGEWRIDDIEHPRELGLGKFDVVICSDVIEHLKDPDLLIDYLKRLMGKGSWLVLSTPERDKVRGEDDMGPPANPAHVREWNSQELKSYIKEAGFEVIEQILVKDREGKQKDQPRRRFGATCQVIAARLQSE